MKEIGILGGICTTHAPQLWTVPDTEDPEVVSRVKEMVGKIGERLKGLKPDICIVIANDHANQFLLHCTGAFTVHIGNRASGSFAGRDYSYQVAGETALELIKYAQEHGYDPAFTSTAKLDYAFGIPLDFAKIDIPIIPIFVNAYIPPQPSMERCFAFGKTLRRGIERLGLSAIVVCSGGLSHFPGTERYRDPGPCTDFDEHLMDTLAEGNTRFLLTLDDKKLDDTGNIELRCWGVAFGLIDGGRPDTTGFEPTWHHNYGTVAWTQGSLKEAFEPHYPPIRPDRVLLSETLHNLTLIETERTQYITDPRKYTLSISGLTPEEAEALINLDQSKMISLGVHPFVSHAFRRVLERAGVLKPDGKTS
ncbi:MAG: hypothetical protein VW226_12315 [Rhodospirillaceae bacterium]